MTISDVAPGLVGRTTYQQTVELLIRARATIDVLLVSRHLIGIDMDKAEKVREYLDLLLDVVNEAGPGRVNPAPAPDLEPR